VVYMNLKITKRSRIFGPEDRDWKENFLSHAANPLVIEKNGSMAKVLFNSRTLSNRSEVWTLEFDIDTEKVLKGSVRKLLSENDFPTFASDGVSLGGILDNYECHSIFFMGWKAPVDRHWYGELGQLRIKNNANLSIAIDQDPTLVIGRDEPISISYADSGQIGESVFMWYGTTETWDGGNGEMIHTIKVREFSNGKWINPKTVIEPIIGYAQAFSKPSFINLLGTPILAFSYRGNSNKYRIGFCTLTESGIGSEFKWENFLPNENSWESEMVEYPFLFQHKQELKMLYNGNNYGRTGFGMATLKY
jgi:hypothetical protein